METKDKLQARLVELKEQKVKVAEQFGNKYQPIYDEHIEAIEQVLNMYDLLTNLGWQLNIDATLIFTLDALFTDYEIMYARNNHWYYQSTNKLNGKIEVNRLSTEDIIAEVKQF